MFQRLALTPVLLGLIAFGVGALSLTTIWSDLDGRAFDILSTYKPALPDEPGVTVIAIDEPSMNAIGEQWPWPRSRHAELIGALRGAGAKAIAFDVIFAEPTVPEEDQALIDAMGPDVILAADESQVERSYGSTLIRTEPMPELLEAGAKTGIASLSLDGDGVLRNIARYEDGFMAMLLNSVGGNADIGKNGGRNIQYFGGPGSYPTVSYYQAMDPENYLPPDYFRDQIVIVGFALQASADVGSMATDAFETPFTLSTRQLTPGVEVQATIFDNLRTGIAIANAPKWLGLLLIFLGTAAVLLISQPRAPWKKFALWGLSIAVVAAASWLTLRFGRLWVAPVGPALAITGGVIAIAARDFAVEQRQRREIQTAFGQYLAPEMVKKIADDPSLLNLGGESRELTILFSDIRGFTSISEAMKDDPQGLTRMINTILTPLSNIIITHGGTIDKYMGDCVMAFWNAPLDDPDHALHALEAAREMLQAMEQINNDIRALLPSDADVPQIKMGIGVNTGTCVVGNMGSDQRFDYSVLGDTVNIASRLEGQCKEYQKDILIGENTVRSIDSMEFEKVADIKVKGRSASVEVFTLN